MSQYGDKAYELFMQGHNCAQAVAGAFAAEMGLPQEKVMQMAVGFGGGFGRMREVCGAFSGLTLALGTIYGSADPAQKTALYAAVQQLGAEFRRQNGADSLVCRVLRGLEKPEGSPEASPRTAEYYKKRPCQELCRLAADLLADYIAEHPAPQKEAAK